MDSGRDSKLADVVNSAIANGTVPGCVIGTVNVIGQKTIHPFGRFTFENDSPSVNSNTIYDAASVTKVVPVSTLALMALERGLFRLDTLLSDIIHEYRSPAAGHVQIQHLLTHTLDFDFRLSSLKDQDSDAILNSIMIVPLKYPPGRSFFYSNATSILLGIAVERVFGSTLHDLAEKMLFRPLGMNDSAFRPDSSLISRIPPSEIDDWRGGIVRGVVHDESAWVLQRSMTPGSAGLFTTVPDLLSFLRMIISGGTVDGRTCLQSDTIGSISKNHIEYLGLSAGLGWELCQRRYMGSASSDRTIGKTGFTGCVIMADMEKGMALAMLTNYTWPKRKSGPEAVNALRSAIADIVFSD